ncbi:MAG: DUF5362 family protein [Cyclobacteriaceae bacterium]
MIDQIENNDLSLTTGAKMFLKESAGWTKFISIVGFVFIGFLIIIALFAGTFLGAMMEASGMNMMGGAFITVFYLVIAVINFFPIYYLFQFSSKMKAALQTQSSELLEQAFSNLKSHYKFMGILLIIVLGLYAIALIFGGLAAAMM